VFSFQIGLSIFAALFSFKSGIELLAAVGYGAIGNLREAISTWLYFIPNALFAMSLRVFERRTAHTFLLYGAMQIACCAIRNLVLFQNSAHLLIDILASLSFSALLIAAVILFGRQIAKYRAHAVVLKDRRRYDTIWEQLIQDAAFTEAICELKHELAQLSEKIEEDTCRQLNRQKRADPQSRSGPRKLIRSLSLRSTNRRMGKRLVIQVGHGASGEPWTLDSSRPLKSMDQLFFQASGLYFIFLAKVQVRCRWFSA
jgi:hypothetical protein